MKSIKQRLSEDELVVMDGAMGTELYRRGVKTELPLWSAQALIHNPKIVRDIHEDYIRAGAEIITTNTFRTTSRALNKKELSARAKELTDLAATQAKRARDAAADHPVWIAGSVAPLEDCYEPGLMPDAETAFREHSELIQWLADAGVDLILIETMNTIQETIAAARAAQSCGLPIFISWTCSPNAKILNGESIQDAIRSLELFNPSAFLVNCTSCNNIPPALEKMNEVSKVPIGAYANIGKAEPVFGWQFTYESDPAAYAVEAEKWIQIGAKIVGGCCGTTPKHISLLKNLVHSDFKLK